MTDDAITRGERDANTLAKSGSDTRRASSRSGRPDQHDAENGQHTFKPTPLRNIHDHVIDELGKRIVGGQLHQGEVLPREEQLAERMDVSRTTLREAIKVLAAKGLVESRPKVGTRVRDSRFWHQLDANVLAWRCASMPTEDFVRKLVDMREMIEPSAAAAAARYCNSRQWEVLEAAYASMEAATSLDEWTVADLDFHEAVLSATNNELMIALFSVIETSLGTFFALSARTAKNFKYSLPHHHKVLEAIRHRQPDAARRAMQHMVADARLNMKQHGQGHGEAAAR